MNFEVSAYINLANISMAKASHIAKSRVSLEKTPPKRRAQRHDLISPKKKKKVKDLKKNRVKGALTLILVQALLASCLFSFLISFVKQMCLGEEPGRLQSMGLLTAGHNGVTNTFNFRLIK